MPVNDAPRVAMHELRSVWFQVTGTLCNLACRHCLNTSGPGQPWLAGLDAAVVRRGIAEAGALGVRELYFTGGEPFLHAEILPLLADALAVAPTTVLTNGTLIDDTVADRLATLASGSPYSLEIRVSVDGATPETNDRVRGRGTFAKALGAIIRLDARRLYPIVTATEIAAPRDGPSLYERLRAFLRDAGVERPRVKILPVLPAGRCERSASRRLTVEDLADSDTARPMCAETRVIAATGIYACPILAGLPGARVGTAARRRARPDLALPPGLRHLPRDRARMPELLMLRRIALLGGVYANDLALEAALDAARARGAEACFCLGDLGGFGPHPDRVFPMLRQRGVACVHGNYDQAPALDGDDCGCGYTDPRDNHYARISYEYTRRRTSEKHRRWLGTLPASRRITLGDWRLLLCHGSPRQNNEFLWETTTPNGLLERFCDDWRTDVLAFTHTGIKWHRELPSGRHAVNVGAIGRPENDGTSAVWYALVTADPALSVEFVPVHYDHEALAWEMTREGLPAEFVETIRTGWWTCCLESLPVKERARGRY